MDRKLALGDRTILDYTANLPRQSSRGAPRARCLLIHAPGAPQRRGQRLRQMIDRACHRRRAEPVVDIDDRDTGGAAVQHSKESGNSTKACSVPNTRWHRHNRDINKTGDDAGEGSFHAGHDNHDMRSVEARLLGEQSMQSRHSDIVEPVNAVPHDLCRDDRLLGDRQVGGSCRDNQDGSTAGWKRGRTQCNGSRVFMKRCSGETTPDGFEAFDIRSRDEEVVACGHDAFGNCRDLFGSFARSVDHFGKSLTHASVVIYARKLEILVRRVAQIL